MPVPPKDEDPRPEQRKKQLAHGAQSDQGGKAYRPESAKETPQPQAYEGPEESNQQRR